MAKKKKIDLTQAEAEEFFYKVNTYYITLRAAENIDKSFFENLKFWNPTMNNHLRRARQSIGELLREFNTRFKAVDSDLVDYDAPGELYEAIDLLSRLHPDKIREITQNIKNQNQ